MIRIIFLALVLPMGCFCSDWTSVYGADKLESRRATLTRDVHTVIAQEITPFLTLEQSHAFSKIQLDLPVSVAPEPNLLDSFVVGDSHIVLPLLTIAFIEDMAQAYAWLWANHYSSKTVDEYMGMLRERAPKDFPGQQYPSPLVALHIPADAMEDPAVAKMALRVRGTTLSFLLLHQFGHLSYVPSAEEPALRHDPVESSEERADSIALEVMKRNSETPAGLLMLIHGMMYLPTVAPKNHPLSDARLKAISDYLDSHVRDFSEGRPDRKLARIAIEALAGHIRQAERYLSDTTGQQLWAEERRRTTIADLAPRQLAIAQ